MRDESQNALLKTLEEPPGFAHLILLSSEPEALLETISSRCQPIEFAALPSRGGRGGAGGRSALDADRGGRRRRPPRGGRPRAAPASCSPTAGRQLRPRLSSWQGGGGASRQLSLPARRPPPLNRGEAAGRCRGGRERRRGRRPRGARGGEGGGRQALGQGDRRRGEAGRAPPPHRDPRPRPRALRLAGSATSRRVGSGAEEVAFNRDRLAQLRAAAEGLDPAAARRAAELVQDTRRRLDLNVSEELALEALYFRLEREID